MKVFDRVRVATATTGQGTLTLGAAVSSNFFTLAEAGAIDGDEGMFVIEESGNIEIATGVVGDSATTITRATVFRSKITGSVGTSKIELGGSATVYFVDSAFFLNSLEGRAGFLRKFPEIAAKTVDYTVTTADAGVPLIANKATAITFNLPALASSQNEFYFFRNIGVGTLTLDGNAAETIEGAATIAITTGMAAIVWPNEGKTAWRAQVIGPTAVEIHGATAKVTPVDLDEFGFWDSVSTGLRKLTWANIKTMLLWATITNAATAKTTPVDADLFSIVDSAASNVIKKLTWANLKATLAAGVGHMPVGSVVDSVVGTYAANANLSTIIPIDDTIPQSTEGTQIISVSITPKSTSNKLRARFTGTGSADSTSHVVAALFLNSDTGAVKASHSTPGQTTYGIPLALEHEWVPASVSAQTIKIRVGPAAVGAIMRMNGNPSGRFFGGASAAVLTVEEIKV